MLNGSESKGFDQRTLPLMYFVLNIYIYIINLFLFVLLENEHFNSPGALFPALAKIGHLGQPMFPLPSMAPLPWAHLPALASGHSLVLATGLVHSPDVPSHCASQDKLVPLTDLPCLWGLWDPYSDPGRIDQPFPAWDHGTLCWLMAWHWQQRGPTLRWAPEGGHMSISF